MKKNLSLLLILTYIVLSLPSCNDTNNDAPAAVLPIPSEEQINWQKLET